MTDLPDRIDAPFLAEPGFRAVMAAVARDGDAAWAVGGAVRNALLGEPVADVDVATTALPETVMHRARQAGLKPVPTGLDHGTITVVADHRGYEVTTLRADVETDGRRAVVAFTRDVAVDAGRRDFTMNAIYADLEGRLLDPTGGIADALDGRVRFIGDADARIREDYLRILRFFRFHATYGRNGPDPGGLAACRAAADGLARLSRERIGQEMRKLVAARRAPETLALMVEAGILAAALDGPGRPERLAVARGLAAEAGLALDRAAAIALVGAEAPADADRLAAALKLSNAEREAIRALVRAAALVGPDPSEKAVRAAVYRRGTEAVVGGLLLAAATEGTRPLAALAEATRFRPPRFPLTGRHLLAAGVPPGPALGARLKAREEAWIAADFPEEVPEA